MTDYARPGSMEHEELREIFSGIRTAQADSAKALQTMAVHEAKCDGRYATIELRLRAVLWVLTSLAGACGAVGIFAVQRWLFP